MRKGAGLMLDGLSEDAFAQASSIYIDEEFEVRTIKARKGAGQKFKSFVVSGEGFQDFERDKVCVNFSPSPE